MSFTDPMSSPYDFPVDSPATPLARMLNLAAQVGDPVWAHVSEFVSLYLGCDIGDVLHEVRSTAHADEYSQNPPLVNPWDYPKNWYAIWPLDLLDPPRHLSCELGKDWEKRRDAAVAGPRLSVPFVKRDSEDERVTKAWALFINRLGAKPDAKQCGLHALDKDEWELACALAQELVGVLPAETPRSRSDAQHTFRALVEGRSLLPEVKDAAWRLVDEPTIIQGRRILERPERLCQGLSATATSLWVFRLPSNITY